MADELDSKSSVAIHVGSSPTLPTIFIKLSMKGNSNVKQQKQYHPKSWSKQARELSDRIIEQVQSGEYSCCIDWGYDTLLNSYRCDLIRDRALARFARWHRRGKLHENSVAAEKWRQKVEYERQHFYC